MSKDPTVQPKAADPDVLAMVNGLVGLPQIAEMLNAVYHLIGDDAIDKDTPSMWDVRSEHARRGSDGVGAIDVVMPKPDVIIPGRRRRKFWEGRKVVEWYGKWKGIDALGVYR